MFCPNCGKDCGAFKFCPECGTQLCITEPDYIGIRAERMFPEPPLEQINSRLGMLELNTDSLFVSVQPPYLPLREIWIAYDEIFAVSYLPATWWRNGFLCVREWKDRHIPVPKRFLEMTSGNVTIWFEQKDNREYESVYEFLKQCAEINATQRQN